MRRVHVKHIVLIAGEESGDAHAAALVRALSGKGEFTFTGIGGKHMQEAGVTLLSDLARHGVTGLTEVLRHARTIHKAFRSVQKWLRENPPDLLILVDYPGFNLRLARFAKHTLGLRILYYISPQIWAWKAGRLKTIQACVDHMAVILPFEKTLYESAGVPVTYVGHPLLEKVTPCDTPEATRQSLGLPLNAPLLALLPGSRIQEVERHLPVMRDAFLRLRKRFPDLEAVIPIARTLERSFVEAFFTDATLPVHFINGEALAVAGCSDAIAVASGTASLECALLQKPMCIIYKVSLLTSMVAAKVMRVKYLGLCNLLEGGMIVPELLQYDCNAPALAEVLGTLLKDQSARARMVQRLTRMRERLTTDKADKGLPELVLELLEA
ncbi:lipid-A-disaccharide synthase [Legionella geestiana]|uniref:Lipid-A-disaccharide synthase n=1 Tax=Legionella geestiana TaxID=45065 RepID=A0A0W0TYM2_9GAMM|nr:lipid-A-disaccharide synthase [Legionella geestiana]QBS11575.1 lipid-A-disaccharide synthase [Legionella geestiana]QDQ40817.1 lipid-A-disaccharide synthase [Legionella geestiana]STX53751.1 lipid-A-disaccharide synthase [Legionella geestiana]